MSEDQIPRRGKGRVLTSTKRRRDRPSRSSSPSAETLAGTGRGGGRGGGDEERGNAKSGKRREGRGGVLEDAADRDEVCGGCVRAWSVRKASLLLVRLTCGVK